MPVVAVNKKKSKEIIVVKKMRDYSNDPTFKKKAEKAKAFLKKNGLPKAFTNNSK